MLHRYRIGLGVTALLAVLMPASGVRPVEASPPVAFPDRPVLRIVYETTPNAPRHLGEGTAIDWDRPGLTLELLKRVGERVRVNLEFRRVPWKRGLLLIETGEADGIFHTSFVPERETFGVFPKTVDGRPDDRRALFFQSYALFVQAGSPVTWNGAVIEGLDGQPVGATAGYAIVGELLRRGVPVEEGRSPALNLAKLAEGRVAAYAELETLAEGMIRSDPTRFAAIVKRGPPLLAKAYFLMLSLPFVRNDPALAEAVWDAIAEVRDSPEFIRLEVDYANGS